jgi:hypothetical protein
LDASGAAIKGGSRKAPHRKMRPNKPFQPKNKDYLTDALAAIVEASLDTDKSRRQGLQETKNTAVDIVERVTGYKQVCHCSCCNQPCINSHIGRLILLLFKAACS